MCSCIPIWFQHNTYRYYIIPTDDVPERSIKMQQIDNISRIKNDAKPQVREKKKKQQRWPALWHKTCSSVLHWTLQVPKAELKGMWQLLIGYRKPQRQKKPTTTHPSGCMTCVLSVEHSMKQTVAARRGKNKENMCDSIPKSKMWSSQMQDLLSRVRVQHPSLPNLIHYKHGQAIHKLSNTFLSLRHFMSKRGYTVNQFFRERQQQRYHFCQNNI